MFSWSTVLDENDRSDALEHLFQMEPAELMRAACEKAADKPELLATPCIVNRYCSTTPPCRHCKWRPWKQGQSDIYVKRSADAAVAHAAMLRAKGVQRMFLASGWLGYQLPEGYYDVVRAVRAHSDIQLYGLFGALDRTSLQKLKDAGLDGYLCGLESPNEEVYRSFRPGGDTLASRVQALCDAKEIGLKIWTGFLYGFGENEWDMKQAFLFFRKLNPDSLSVLPFEPFPETEMERCDSPNLYQWAKIVAIGRLFLGDINVFVSHGAHNMVAYGRNAGANAFYYFPA